MSDVTQILNAIEEGDPQAADELLPLLYNDLRRLAAARMANEASDHTLQATALVHEAYVRLVGSDQSENWEGRGHFFAAAAEAMRRILVDSARRKQAQKRGGDDIAVDLGAIDVPAIESPVDLLALDEAIERLSQRDSAKAELVKLRFFGGLTNREAAAALGISTSTADNYWAYARCWLKQQLSEQ